MFGGGDKVFLILMVVMIDRAYICTCLGVFRMFKLKIIKLLLKSYWVLKNYVFQSVSFTPRF